jgi:murein L,D-transpeptidase YafK
MKQIRQIHILLLSAVFFSTTLCAGEAVSLHIDTEKLTLEVKRGSEILAVMENISIGRNGAGTKKRVGDDVTPIGTYKIKWINNKSRFYKFYGFNYPSANNAKEAFEHGRLDNYSYKAVVKAHKRNRVPPQYTPIGGQIGIHGLGAGDKKVHKLYNWTHGCIALTNKQIDKLSRWIGKETVVKIK